jgi:hypothetical protein
MVKITLGDGYLVDVRSRWGHSVAAHPELRAALEQWRPLYEQSLDELARHRTALHDIKHEPNPNAATEPCWNNLWFSVLDAASLLGFLLSRRPERYVEIGSGYCTMFARHAIRTGNLKTTIMSIDPKSRAEIDSLCDRVMRLPLELCDLNLFRELEPGDILFFDGSHRIFANSDVTVFFIEVLPRLKPGVLVHVHDIFLPADYPPAWDGRLYSEQYLLAAMLLCAAPPFRVLLPNYFVSTDAALSARVREIFKGTGGQRNIPFFYNNDAATPGVSFWFETVPVDRATAQ